MTPFMWRFRGSSECHSPSSLRPSTSVPGSISNSTRSTRPPSRRASSPMDERSMVKGSWRRCGWLLHELYAGGVPLHALSNYPRWYQLIEDRLELSRYLRWSFVSCLIGMRKPCSRSASLAAIPWRRIVLRARPATRLGISSCARSMPRAARGRQGIPASSSTHVIPGPCVPPPSSYPIAWGSAAAPRFARSVSRRRVFPGRSAHPTSMRGRHRLAWKRSGCAHYPNLRASSSSSSVHVVVSVSRPPGPSRTRCDFRPCHHSTLPHANIAGPLGVPPVKMKVLLPVWNIPTRGAEPRRAIDSALGAADNKEGL